MKNIGMCLFSFLIVCSLTHNGIAQTYMPIYVTGMVHIDPLPNDVPDSTIVIQAYSNHRSALLWYINFANQNGLRLSAQTTGVYAEACIRQGHESDFLSFMPGGLHHLGTHAHANVKTARAYIWHTLAQQFFHNPDSVKKIMFDNIPWVNQVFAANGFSANDNWYFHGTHGNYDRMDTLLVTSLSSSVRPYQNNYSMAGALRGGQYVYRGGFSTEPSQSSDTSFVKIPEVGGIIGFDELHGPEGMVYGTFPYQKRDFLRVYIEWREAVRRNEPSAVRFFSWMIHPYQLIPTMKGTDGRSPRTHIQDLVTWLNNNFIDKSDESGNIVARYANVSEIRSMYDSWRSKYPQYDQRLQSILENKQKPLYFPAIFNRLETTYHDQTLVTKDPSLVIHRMMDRVKNKPVFLVWSKSGSRSIEPELTGNFNVLFSDGTTKIMTSTLINADVQPMILEAVAPTNVDENNSQPLGFRLEQNYPNPFSQSTTVRFQISDYGLASQTEISNRKSRYSEFAAANLRSSTIISLKVYDLLGREVIDLSDRIIDNPPSADKLTIDNLQLHNPGLYFYRLTVGTKSQTKMMMMIR